MLNNTNNNICINDNNIDDNNDNIHDNKFQEDLEIITHPLIDTIKKAQVNLGLIWDILAIAWVKNNTNGDYESKQSESTTIVVKNFFIKLLSNSKGGNHYGNMWQNAR